MKYNVYRLLFLLGLFAVYACSNSDQRFLLDENIPHDKLAIELEYILPVSHGVQSRARVYEVGQAVENAIKRLDAFVFDTNDDIIGHFSLGDKLIKVETSNTIRLIIENNEVNKYKDRSLNIYLVANYEFTTAINELNELLEITHELALNNTKITSFVMDGKISVNNITWASQIHKITEQLKLSRAAAKIEFQLDKVAVIQNANGSELEYQIAQDQKPEVRLINYVRKTNIIDSSSKTNFETTDTNYKEMTLGSGTSYSFENIYSYESDWSTTDGFNAENQAYLLVKLPLQAKDENQVLGEVKNYFYKVLISPSYLISGLSEVEKATLNKIKRNYLYRVSAGISILGSEDESTPLEVKGKLGIYPWINVNVDGDIEAAHYLQVKEKNIIMPNIKDISIPYYSDLEVEIIDMEAKFDTYNEEGDIVPNISTSTVEVYLDKENKGHIKIETKDLPKNYVPLNIYFTVRHKDASSNLSERVHAVQYPAKYITAKRSQGFVNSISSIPDADFRFHNTLGITYEDPNNPELMSPQKNKLLFKVTTLVPSAMDIIGDPQDNSNGLTYQDEEINKIVSPEFVIASQHGLSNHIIQRHKEGSLLTLWYESATFGESFGPIHGHSALPPYSSDVSHKNKIYYGFSNAEERCANYFEDEYGTNGDYIEHYIGRDGDVASRTVSKKFRYEGKWRLPTLAELTYINNIQADVNSAVKRLLWGPKYWSALSGKGFNFTARKSEELVDAAVRCVFDTWKIENYEK